jgi:hypothetical protein
MYLYCVLIAAWKQDGPGVGGILYFDNRKNAVRESLVDDNYDYRAETVAFAPSSHPACNGPAFCFTCACLAVYLPVSLNLSGCPAYLHAWLPAFLLRNAACFYLICQFSLPFKFSFFVLALSYFLFSFFSSYLFSCILVSL